MSPSAEDQNPSTESGPRRGLLSEIRQKVFPSRQAPSGAAVQAAQVRDRRYDGNTRAMAAAYGVSSRTVLRWIDGSRRPVLHQDQLRREATEVQTTARGRERRAREMERRGDFAGITARVGRANTFEIQGSDAIRARDIYLTLSGTQAAALVRAENEEETQAVIGQALADYFNGGSLYGGFTRDDFTYDPDDFSLT